MVLKDHLICASLLICVGILEGYLICERHLIIVLKYHLICASHLICVEIPEGYLIDERHLICVGILGGHLIMISESHFICDSQFA